MGCLRRITFVMIFALFLVTFGASLIVLGSAGVLGDAAIISATDGTVLFVLNAASAGALVILGLMLWFGGRVRRRQDRELRQSQPTGASIPREAPARAIEQAPHVTCPRCGAAVPMNATACQNCGLARTATP